MNIVEQKIEEATKPMLIEMAGLLFDNMQDGADYVFNKVLDRLEVIMSEDEFISFCEAM